MVILVLAAALGIGIGVWLLPGLRERLRRFGRFSANADRMQEEAGRISRSIDYTTYRLSARERAVVLAIAGAGCFAVGYLFYKNGLVAALFVLLACKAPQLRASALKRRRQTELNGQFRQALFSLTSALSAGRSVENAFLGAVPDLKLLYPDEQTYIVAEFAKIAARLRNGETIEQALGDFAVRSGIEDIANFAEVFAICKRSGGNLVEVMRRTAHLIGEKIEIQQDIAVLIAQKRFESKALGLAPAAVIAVLTLSSPDYMAPLYGNVPGFSIMTIALLALAGCFQLTQRMMNIKV